MITYAIYAALALVGAGAGWTVRQVMLTRTSKNIEAKKKEILLNAKDEALKIKEDAKKEEDERRASLRELENKLREKDVYIDKKLEKIDTDREDLERQRKSLEGTRNEITKLREEANNKLKAISKLTPDEAKKQLITEIEKDFSEELIKKMKSLKQANKQHLDMEARDVLSTVIEKLSSTHTAENTISSVDLPNEEIKGKIIGKEGRNIQAFEKLTGVDLVIDESPETVAISCFDPVRRAVAHKALEMLIKDGRIQPAKIEEFVIKSKAQVEEEIKEAGENALMELSINGINPELTRLLGSMKYRTSYGQNQLFHAIESAKIAELLAREIGADPIISKKAALFHDIGKSVSQEQEGSHVDIGVELGRKYGLSEAVVHCIAASHEDIDAKSVEAIISRTADAISSSRPGARRESTEMYIKRMQDLEKVALSFSGVDKVYAIQAGREVRVFVKPEMIDDLMAIKLAREVADKIESTLNYPGTVRVNVIRETRASEVAK